MAQAQKTGLTHKPRLGLYPGTYDPVTLGHLDIVKRAVKLVDHLVIGIATGVGKVPLFSLEERVAMWRHEAEPIARGHATIEVIPFDKKLQVDFARELGASVIIRGLRAETVVIMADPRYQAIASRLVKEIALLDGDVSAFTSPYIADLLIKRCKELVDH